MSREPQPRGAGGADDRPDAGERAASVVQRSVQGRQARRRALCIWLGTVASWRRGLVQRLVKQHGAISKVLDRSAEELRAAILTPAAPRRPPAGGAAQGVPSPRDEAERSDEERRFAGALAMDPSECAARQDADPRGVVIAWNDPLYPPALRQLADAPLCLFVRAQCGDDELHRRLQDLCGRPAVAIVGTRTPSAYGEEMATMLGRDLARQRVLVVSGLAMGVDALAQRAAADAGKVPAATVGVLGCGVDIVYPRLNAALFREVERKGLLVSEFSWGVPARAWRFPARNRVMAALSRGVVVVEGGERSGSQLTAKHAADLGREVFAVPGEAGRRLSAAPHRLLREGAALCESAADVIAGIATVTLPQAAKLAGELQAPLVAVLLRSADAGCGATAEVLAVVAGSAVTPDQVAKRCGMPVHVAAAALSELEVDGLVERLDGGRYRQRR